MMSRAVNLLRGMARGATRKLGVEHLIGKRREDRLVRELKYYMGGVWLYREEGNLEKTDKYFDTLETFLKEEVEDINKLIENDIQIFKGILYFGDVPMLRLFLENGLEPERFVPSLSHRWTERVEQMFAMVENGEQDILGEMNISEKRLLPNNAQNAISWEDIAPGTMMVNFKNKTKGSKYESEYSRYYTQNTLDKYLKTTQKHPFTSKKINMKSIVSYKASKQKKTEGGKAKTRKVKKGKHER